MIFRKHHTKRFLTFIMCCVVELAAAQRDDVQKFVITSWGLKDGLPQSSVNHIIQTRDGYLWLATFGGLVRFNGESFTTFDRTNSGDIVSDRILSLFEDSKGTIWCSTEGGLHRFGNNRFSTVRILDETHSYSPNMIAEDTRGVLWISANVTPYRYVDSVFVSVPVLLDPVLAQKAVYDRSGVWLAHGKHLLRTIGDSIVLVKDFSGLIQDDFQDVVEYPEGSGQVWMASDGSGIVRYAGGQVSIFGPEKGIPSRYLYRLSVDHEGNLWTAGFNGISMWNGKQFVQLRTVTGVIDRELKNIMQDREGNYWGGTPSFGLHRLKPARVSMIGKAEGLTEEKTLSLTRLKDGTFLFGTNCGGIYEWNGKKAIYPDFNKRLVNLCTWSVFEDSRQRLWVGSYVLEQFNPERTHATVFDEASGFTGRDIFAIMEDSKGTVWIGCLNGLFRYDGERFYHYAKERGLANVEVRSLYEDRSGTLWIGTTNGIFRRDNDSIVAVPIAISNNGAQHQYNVYIRSIYQDKDGVLWCGSYGNGIFRLKNGSWSVITMQQGLFDNIVSHIMEDGRNNFWMGSNRGISRVTRASLNDVADGISDAVRSVSYGTLDGMASPETNGGFQPSVATDDQGRIYFPTVAGIAVVNTRAMKQNDSLPPVLIETLVSGDSLLDKSKPVILPYDKADLEIRYTALSFVDRSKIQYRYRLEGLQENWYNAGTRSSAYFTNIPPGTWTFRVIASNNDGVWNMDGDTLIITVTPPFWNTWWFYTVVALFFAATGPLVYYVRVTQLEKEKQSKMLFAEQLIESQERERRRIAADLHDGLGQQILIIKNRVELALRSLPQSENITEQLKEIALSAQSSLNDVRSISHGLRPVHLEQFGLRETLINLCDQISRTSSVDWVCHIDDIDGVIPREQEINFYRIIQEGTNNILKHSGATQASIMIRHSDDVLTASLWDNGKGFDPAAVTEKKGLGLNGIHERAHILGGTVEIQSSSGEGTTLILTVPGKNRT